METGRTVNSQSTGASRQRGNGEGERDGGRGREMEGGEKEGGRKEGREEKEGGKGFSDILAILFIIHAKSPALLCLGHVTGSWV